MPTCSKIPAALLLISVGLVTLAPIAAHAEEGDYILHSFGQGSDGQSPMSPLIKVNGLFYGTTPFGGANGVGTIYSITPQGAEKVLYSFNGFNTYDGALPYSGLTYVNGVFYGTTSSGGSGNGTVFSFKPGGTPKVLYAFTGDTGIGFPGDGCNPGTELLFFDGALYGTAGCGFYGDGVAFKVGLDGKETILHSFNPSTVDGGAPSGGLIELNGVLYGTTAQGGRAGQGTVFSLTDSGAYHIVYSFRGGRDGFQPSGTLLDIGGIFYGTTQLGGYYGKGTVFSVTPAGSEQTIHAFGSLKGDQYPGGGEYPYAGLIEVGGLLYGTTNQGGAHNGGVVFSITPQGVVTVVHAALGGLDGTGTYTPLKNGGAALYGVRYAGGANNQGVVFRLITPHQ